MGLFSKEKAGNLIVEGEFQLKEFKKIYKEMKWVRAPRVLTSKHSDYFYLGTFENEEKRIVAKIRPSMIMALEETFKGFDEKGRKTKEGYRGKSYEFGTTIEVKVDDKFMEKIKKVASEFKQDKTQKVSW